MNLRPITLATLVLVSAAGGYLLGTWRQTPSRSVPPAVVAGPAQAAPDPEPVGTAPRTVPADYQAVKNQLALCMAYHPSDDEKDKQLAMCRSNLGMYKNPQTVPDCYDFADLASIYDRELGESDPSPETLERAKSLTLTDCVRVMTWSGRARKQQSSCLKGETPPGFKERYGRPIRERPFLKACGVSFSRTDLLNAWMEREEDRARELGHDVKNHLRFGPDGGLLAGAPSSILDE